MNEIRAAREGGIAYSISPDVLIPLCWVFVGLATAFLFVRTYIRFWLIPQQRKIWPDAWLYLSFLFLVVGAVIATIMAPILRDDIPARGLPRSNSKTIKYARLQFAYMIIFWSALWSIKATFLAIFKPLLVSSSVHNMRRSWWTVASVTVITYLTCWVVAFLTNNPASESVTNKSGLYGMFFDDRRRILVTYSTTVDIITDILIIALPVRLIWAVKTKLSTSQRVALSGIFAVSFIIVAVAIVRGVELASDFKSTPARFIIWSVVESAIAVIVGCLPTYKALFSSRTGPLLSRRSRSDITEITSITPRHSTTSLSSTRGVDDYRNGYERKNSKESRANSTTPILSDDTHGPLFEDSRPRDRSWRKPSPIEQDRPLEPNATFRPARAEPVNGTISPYSKAWIPPTSNFRNFSFNPTPPSPSPSHANTLPENIHVSDAKSKIPNFSRSRFSPLLHSQKSSPKQPDVASRLRRRSDSQYIPTPSQPARAFSPLLKTRVPSPSIPKPTSNNAPRPPPPPPPHLCPPVRKQTPLTTPILEMTPATPKSPPLSPLRRNPSSVYSIPLSPGIHQINQSNSGHSTPSRSMPRIDTTKTHVRSDTLTSDPPVMSPRIQDFVSEAESPLWLTKPAFPPTP
ncbi:MAG: hypothetical protein Q9160_004319 [Pyrenula sp. 1 TL-2023]